MYRILAAATALLMTACATPGAAPATPPSPATQSSATSPQAEIVAQQAVEPASSATDEQEIEVVAVPGIAPAPAATVQATNGSGDEVICRREIPTGSRLAVRVCHTRAEIDARQERDRAWLDEKQQTGLAGMGGSNF